ncbi:rho-N domain-containing protein 1, chloroplastic-like [Dorcoceras hygrometricum]|uniref:Rho-N domain-containing protein 1, chloroplastic-like n=1 Tax=Dorcoceras hygrometricum TaxID=472368 RepID=A0A2Z7BF69_9LAMI|nr:rho-N domain-containing protein 1, chloroplastic-like [Dorcoceras hygrometricum]
MPPDSRCIPFSGFSGKISVDSSNGGIKLVSNLKFLSSRHASSRTTLLCNASPSKYRRNSDYPRRKKHGYSHSGKRPTAEKGGFEDLEESETNSSRNGSLLSTSQNQNLQATAAPGPQEKEIVEIFRKVQAKLRERASLKVEKKVEDPQGKGKENGTVDSLLKLLRKHSVQQRKKNTSSASNKEFILDEPEPIRSSVQERNTNSLESNSRLKKHAAQEGQGSLLSRPKSTFQKRSPVPKVKFQPLYFHNSVNHVSRDNLDDTTKGIETDSESYVEPTFSEESVYDAIGDGLSEFYESEHEHDLAVEEHIEDEAINLSRMKLTELRHLARSRGLKGFSKLKKKRACRFPESEFHLIAFPLYQESQWRI